MAVLLKQKFISNVLSETFTNILKEQDKAIDDYNLNKTGLLRSRAKRHFSVNMIDKGAKATLSVLKYLRFLDMRELKNMHRRRQYHLYNRILYGHIYNPMLAKLFTGYTEEIKQQIAKQHTIEL